MFDQKTEYWKLMANVLLFADVYATVSTNICQRWRNFHSGKHWLFGYDQDKSKTSKT